MIAINETEFWLTWAPLLIAAKFNIKSKAAKSSKHNLKSNIKTISYSCLILIKPNRIKPASYRNTTIYFVCISNRNRKFSLYYRRDCYLALTQRFQFQFYILFATHMAFSSLCDDFWTLSYLVCFTSLFKGSHTDLLWFWLFSVPLNTYKNK